MNPKDLVRTGYDAVSYAYRGDTVPSDDRGTLKYHQWIAELAQHLPAGSAVLDLGCGNGIPATQLLVEHGYAVTGVDLSPVQIERATSLVPGARFLCSDMTSLDLPPESYTAIVSFYAIIHVPVEEQPALLAACYRWLQPGGWLMIVVGHGTWTGTEDDWLGVPGGTMYWSYADAPTYQDWLAAIGFHMHWSRFIPEDDGGHTLMLVQKPGSGIIG